MRSRSAKGSSSIEAAAIGLVAACGGLTGLVAIGLVVIVCVAIGRVAIGCVVAVVDTSGCGATDTLIGG